ncbi:MAG: hypothetical protein ACIAQU_11885 [Phycisphaerales bacterium JB064]
MSAVPAVRAPAGSGPLLEAARSLWPLVGEQWGLSGGVLEGVGGALAHAPMAGGEAPIWPENEGFAPPLVLVGLASADMVARAVRERTGSLQYLPHIFVIEPRAEVALAALARLSAADGEGAVQELLQAPGVEWFVGPEGMANFETWLKGHGDDPLPKQVAMCGAPPEVGQAVARLLGEAHARQQSLLREQAGTLREWANSRQRREAVRRRWRDGESLRVLVCASRFSTYMRHSAADLVKTLEGLGHQAVLLTEPDDHTRQTQLHYTRAIIGFDPDGIVLLNYFRPQLGPVMPPHIPVITWAQDAMGHFFAGADTPRAGALDFVAGMLYPELRDRLGVPESRMLAWPNAVSTVKFHRGPVGDGFEHLRCDVAMMTRHSELPEVYIRKRISEIGEQTPAGRSIAMLESRVPVVLVRAERDQLWLVRAMRAECEAILREAHGRPATPSMIETLLQQIAMPLADLHYRQQAATWAASVCERNGWCLHLYGSGWEDHPQLAKFARGELAHGEELRAAYQLAGVTIHASARGIYHQRVAEAAMSGGLPIVRRSFEEIDRARWFQLNAMVGKVQPHDQTSDGRPRFMIADSDGLMRVASLWGRCGLELGADGLVSPTAYEMDVLKNCALGKPKLPHEDSAWPLVDIGEVGFASEAELEAIVRKAKGSSWRDAWSAAIDARMRERFAMDRFAQGMIDLVRTSFL